MLFFASFFAFFLQQLKTTLGEAEIQSAVEHAAVIFKKVVVQKRAKKLADEGKCSRVLSCHQRSAVYIAFNSRLASFN